MAVLSSDQLTELRQKVASEVATVSWDKSQINAATQAIEDWFESNRASLGAAINAATNPFVFTNPQKLLLVKAWLRQKFERGG